MIEKRIRYGKIKSFFLTRHRWSHIGGLFGFGLTLRDIKICKAEDRGSQSSEPSNVHGPNGLRRIKESSSGFMNYFQHDLNVQDVLQASTKCVLSYRETNREMSVAAISIQSV